MAPENPAPTEPNPRLKLPDPTFVASSSCPTVTDLKLVLFANNVRRQNLLDNKLVKFISWSTHKVSFQLPYFPRSQQIYTIQSLLQYLS